MTRARPDSFGENRMPGTEPDDDDCVVPRATIELPAKR